MKALEIMITQMLLLLTLPIITAAVNNTFRCTAGTYFAGEMAVITCYFPEDVSKQHYNYYVEWFPHSRTDNTNGNEALVCFRTLGGQLVCDPAEGFRFNGAINDRLVLEIPNVSKRFAGRYSCMYIPPDGNVIEACSLFVSVIPKTKVRPNPAEVPGIQKPTATVLASGSKEQTAALQTTILIILTALVGTLCLTTAIFGTICYIRLRRNRREGCGRQHRQNHGTGEETALQTEENVPSKDLQLLAINLRRLLKEGGQPTPSSESPGSTERSEHRNTAENNNATRKVKERTISQRRKDNIVLQLPESEDSCVNLSRANSDSSRGRQVEDPKPQTI